MKAVVVDMSSKARLVVRDVPPPIPRSDEVVVRVRAISLNRGEVRAALADDAEDGARPGWDFAGEVEKAAADKSGPPRGARVVGLVRQGAWAEEVAAPATALAVLPEAVDDAQAASLPVAGLAALHALAHGGLLLGRRVFVEGASGGVGIFACQLAANAGASVVGAIRRPELAAFVENNDAEAVLVGGETGYDAAGARGPYHLILNSVGGDSLGAALAMLTSGGVCVLFGSSAGAGETRFDPSRFYSTGGVRLYGMLLFDEFTRTGQSASVGLACLAGLVADRRLRPHIEVDAPLANIADTARQLLARGFLGKAVVRL